ncbi:MAG: pyrroline-5-carboxylate reductase [Candidatus Nanopelagicales bacterium]|jgi:pyrroline-5-carboxylate reductase
MIGVIGAGAMGEVFVAGLLRAGTEPARLIISEKRTERAEEVSQRYGVRAVPVGQIARECATVLLLVKPQDIPGVIDELASHLADGAVVISLAAGVRLAALEARLPRAAVVRAMPNTPALVDLGITAISPGTSCSATQADYVESLLAAVGPVVRVPEDLQDAVTATSGSGPAYVFRLVEAMIAGSIALGVPPETARQLVSQTVLGAATMAAQPGADAGVLRQQVTSPGGTTAAALAVFDEADLMGLVARAMEAARDRGRELGRE